MPGIGLRGRSGTGDGRVGRVLLLVALLLAALVAAGVRVPGASLARAVVSRILCAAALGDAAATSRR